MRPNVVLVVLDAVRADALEPYGASPDASPAIADLADRGVALPRAYAAATWTLPSHAAMFSGLLPRAARMEGIPGAGPHAYRPRMEAMRNRLLPEVLRRAGYSTGAVSTNLWVTAEGGFDIGFDRFVNVDTARQATLHRDDLRARLAWAFEAVRARADDGAAEAGRILRGWLEPRPKQPFFWFVNLIESHSPYLPPKPYNDLGALDRWRAAREARRYLNLSEIWRACVGGETAPPAALDRMRHLYGRAIQYMDDWIETLLAELDRAGILEETLILVTSDHGENFGDGGLMAHAFSLDDRLLHVPFVAAGPGAPEIEEAWSLTGVPALIAAAAAIEDHPWGDWDPDCGVAVAELDPPGVPDDPRWRTAFDAWGLPFDEAAEQLIQPMTCATDGRYKLLRRGTAEVLYDLDADPLELQPSSPESGPAAVARLRAALERAAELEPHDSLPVEVGPSQATPEELEELEARMRLLGYL
jgi:arylsulfatase A-like enzyme